MRTVSGKLNAINVNDIDPPLPPLVSEWQPDPADCPELWAEDLARYMPMIGALDMTKAVRR